MPRVPRPEVFGLWTPTGEDSSLEPTEGEEAALSIFHASMKTFSRRDGQSAVAASAYRSATRLWDERRGVAADYRGKGGVATSFIILPENAPSWMAERSMLWNMAEWAEKRCNSVVAREWQVALPARLSAAARERIVRMFCHKLVERYGVAVDAAIHLPSTEGDERNHHAHILFTTRAVTPEGFGDKTRILDARKTGAAEVTHMRQEWAGIVNAALAEAGLKDRVDYRSHRDRGMDAPPQIHEGVNARNAARRGEESNLISFPKLDKRGRVIDYPAIDKGVSRHQHNADIIDLQKYRQTETPKEKLVRITAMVISNALSIEQLQAALNIPLLSESTITLLRIRIEQLISQICRQGQETEFLKARREEQAKEKQIKEMQTYQTRLETIQKELQDQVEKEKKKREGDQKIFIAVQDMFTRLNGMPPYIIKLEIPLSSQFNEVVYAATLTKQSNAELMKAVFSSPPTIPAKPALAPAALRQEALQVKELLVRVRPRISGTGSMEAAEKISMRNKSH
jgi:hypothetical protein